MTQDAMLKLIEKNYEAASAGTFDSIEDAIKVACSALKYLEEQSDDFEDASDDDKSN